MRILIIGGTRFVGYQLTWRLIAEGHAVTLLNRGTHADPFGSSVQRVRADRTASDAFERVEGTFDAAIDFAAFHRGDVSGVLEALGDRIGHYVFISTGQVYLVRQPVPRPARETDYEGPLMSRPADPLDAADWDYGIGKRDCEDALIEAWTALRFPSTRLRVPMINGERDHLRRLESYVWRILDGGPVLLPDGGTTPMRHVYSGSLVDAIARMIGDATTFGRAFNLAQDETPTLAEMVALLCQILHAPNRSIAVSSEALTRAGLSPQAVSPFSSRWMSFLDPSLAKSELGFRHVPLDRYVEKIIVTLLAAAPPAERPGNLANRQRELEIARALG